MKYSILTSILLLASASASAGDFWTYSECVDYALSHNITLQKTRLNEQTADINLSESKAQWQPSLDFGTTQGYANYPWADGKNNSYTSNYNFNAAWTVWDGGSRENTIKRNELLSRISRVNTLADERNIRTEILQAYLNILYTRESIDIYEEMAALSKAQADRAKSLMEAGKASKVDYAQLLSQAEQDNYSLVNARGEYSTRCIELKRLLSLSLDGTVQPKPVDYTSAQLLSQLPALSETYEMAVKTDPQLQALRLSEESAKADESIAKAGRMPRIGLTAGVGTGYMSPGNSFGESMKQNFGEQIGLTFSVPIFDNKKTSSAISKARINSLSSRLDSEDRLVTLATNVENWYIDTTTSQSRYSAAMEQLNAAQETDSLTNEKYQVGYVDPLELMSSHNALTEARHKVLQAKYMVILGLKMIEYYRTADITLN